MCVASMRSVRAGAQRFRRHTRTDRRDRVVLDVNVAWFVQRPGVVDRQHRAVFNQDGASHVSSTFA
jgi:hypothetical protein